MAGAIRVTHVIPQIGVGGAERQLREFITRTDPCMVRHDVLYYSDSLDTDELRHYREARISLARVPRNKWRPVRFLRALGRAIGQRHPDIVHCWLFSGTIWGRLAAIRAGVPHILVAHRGTTLVRVPVLRMLERWTGHRVHYMANSRACARSVGERIGVPDSRFHVIPNGIDVSAFEVEAGRSNLLRELGIRDTCRIVASVGRLTEAKNHPMLLRIARRCKTDPSIRYLIIGHGEREIELKRLAAELNVQDVVHFLGLRHDIPRILRAADLFCFTSNHEGFPNAVLEAMAAGLPIVTTDFPGVEELIDDGIHGLVVRRNDDAQGAQAVQLLLNDPERAASLGAAARRRAVESFSMEAMICRTVSLYKAILEGTA